MKIGIISTCQTYSWAGSEENWFWLADTALSGGHEVMLGAHRLVARHARVESLRKRGMQVCERHPFRPMRFYLLKNRWLPDMRALLDFKPDVVLLNAGSPFDFCRVAYLGDFVAQLKCAKVIWLTFNTELVDLHDRQQIRDFFAGLNGSIFVSQHNRRLLERQLALTLPNATVIRNVSRLTINAPLPWPVDDGEIRFASVARFETFLKGHDTMLEVLSSQKWKSRRWKLRLYGTGPDEGYIRDLIAHFELQDRVEFAGWVDGVEKMWRDNHALLLPSRAEGMPLVVLEAMMCGRVVIAAPAGGTPEIIDDGRTGFLATAANENCFDHALECAWNRLIDWPGIGAQAHTAACEINSINPGWAALQFIEKIVGFGPGPRPPEGIRLGLG